MAEKKNIPEIRFKGFDGEWKEKKLGDLMNVTSVKRIHQSDWTNSGIRFLRARDIVSAFKNEEPADCLYISEEKYNEYSMLSGKVKPNDLLVTGVGTIGIPFLIVDEQPMYFKDGNIIWFKNENTIDGKFFFYSFTGSKIQRFIKGSAGTGTVGTYTIDSGKKTHILLPKDNEQSRIGTYFQNLDKLITLHQRKYDKLVQIKKAMLEKMFPKNGADVPEIRFKGFEGKWEENRLGEIGDTFTGLSGKTKEDFGHGEGRYITYMNVFKNPVSDRDMTEPIEIDHCQSEVQYGDVFFTTSSETPEEVGMSSIWLEKLENVYLNSFCFGYRPKVKIDAYFLAYMFRSFSFRKKIAFLAQGISRYNISKNKVMGITMHVPTIDEQNKIGTYFQNLDKLISLHKKEQEKLKNIKKACLEKMFV